MRCHPRGPEGAQHIEFAADPLVPKKLGKPAQFIFLVHAPLAQGGFVEWSETQGLGLAGLHQRQTVRQRLQHEPPVVGTGPPALEGGRRQA